MASGDSKPPPRVEGAGHISLRHSLLGPSLLKAGQDKVDQSKVGEIIYNASKGSKFFKHEEERDEQVCLSLPRSLLRILLVNQVLPTAHETHRDHPATEKASRVFGLVLTNKEGRRRGVVTRTRQAASSAL